MKSTTKQICAAPTILFTTLGSCKYDYRETLERLELQIPALRKTILLDDTTGAYKTVKPSNFFQDYDSFIELGRRQNVDWVKVERGISDADILNLQFTSGSTGAPKAAALTHHGMVNSARYIGLNMELVPADKIIIPVPLFHAFGLIIGNFAKISVR